MSHRLRTKIVCTIGPASREPGLLASLIRAGMDVARLNFSHGDAAYHGESIRRIREAAAAADKPVAILCDLQGPKLRVGVMPEAGLPLAAGETLVLTTELSWDTLASHPEPGHVKRVPVQYEHLPSAVNVSDRILIDDGLIELEVTARQGQEIVTRVVVGGVLLSNKGLNLPRASLAIPAITEKDRQDLRFVLGQPAEGPSTGSELAPNAMRGQALRLSVDGLRPQVDWVALSFVRKAEEVLELKEEVRQLCTPGRPVSVIAKIEKPEAVDNIDAIIAAADGIMVARGDLGIEMPPEAVPMLQKMIVRKCNEAGKPVITATQMLDSMIRNPRPTRAEASDVANAILDGSDAIMLSGETASGKYPLEAVETMARIAQEVERALPCEGCRQIPARPGRSIAEAVAHASVETAMDLNAVAIVAPTISGHTARTIARFRPPCPIVAVTPSERVQRELMLFWGVYPLLSHRAATTDEVINDAVAVATQHGYAKPEDTVVVTAGAAGSGPGTTNLMKTHVVGD